MTANSLPNKVLWRQRARYWHQWLGAIVGLQLLIWVLSGLYMVSIDIEKIHGDHFVNDASPISSQQLIPVPAKFAHAKRVLVTNQLNTPIYIIDNRWLVNATNGEDIIVDQHYISRRAHALFKGNAAIKRIAKLDQYPDELGGRKRAIWRVDYDAQFNPSFYFSPTTAQLLRKRSDLWRMFDFLWSLHIMDYQAGEDSHNTLLLISSLVALLMVSSGLWLMCYALALPTPVGKKGWLVGAHRYLSLTVGIQLLLWVISGIAFNLLSSDMTKATLKMNRAALQSFTPHTIDFNRIIHQYPQASRINVAATSNTPLVYITDGSHRPPMDLELNTRQLNRQQIRVIAIEAIDTQLTIKSISLMPREATESRQFKRLVWQVTFDNEQHSALYIDAYSGRILKIIEDTWRLRDIFWMLHIMDYQYRSDFNHPLLIIAALLATIGSLTGLALLFTTFAFKARSKTSYTLTLNNDKQLFVSANQTLLHAMNNDVQRVPSGCGGQGTCGQCLLKIKGHQQPLNQQEKMTLTSDEITSGFRLSCQTKVNSDLTIEAATSSQLSAQVITTEFVTPYIKTITLQLNSEETVNYRAGQFINLIIPTGEYRVNKVPSNYQTQWRKLTNRTVNVSKKQQRSYSIANNNQGDAIITLMVKLVHNNNQLGLGSGYVFSLKEGDHISLMKPEGDFVLNEDKSREVLLIGAGSGIAPLKALTQQAIDEQRQRISLWYGVRHQEDIVQQDYFDALSHTHKNFQWRLSLSQPKNWQGLTGHIQQHLIKGYLSKTKTLDNIDFYLCGPHALMVDTYHQLIQLGISPQQIKQDNFG